MKQKRKSDVAGLLDYAGSHKRLTFLGLALSAVSMLLSMAPYICIWLAARDLIAVAPDWTEATLRGLSRTSPFTRCSPPSSPRPLPKSCLPHRALCWLAPLWAALIRSWALPS